MDRIDYPVLKNVVQFLDPFGGYNLSIVCKYFGKLRWVSRCNATQNVFSQQFYLHKRCAVCLEEAQHGYFEQGIYIHNYDSCRSRLHYEETVTFKQTKLGVKLERGSYDWGVKSIVKYLQPEYIHLSGTNTEENVLYIGKYFSWGAEETTIQFLSKLIKKDIVVGRLVREFGPNLIPKKETQKTHKFVEEYIMDEDMVFMSVDWYHLKCLEYITKVRTFVSLGDLKWSGVFKTLNKYIKSLGSKNRYNWMMKKIWQLFMYVDDLFGLKTRSAMDILEGMDLHIGACLRNIVKRQIHDFYQRELKIRGVNTNWDPYYLLDCTVVTPDPYQFPETIPNTNLMELRHKVSIMRRNYERMCPCQDCYKTLVMRCYKNTRWRPDGTIELTISP